MSCFRPHSVGAPTFYNKGGWALTQIIHKRCGTFIPRDAKNTAVQDAEQLDLTWKLALLWTEGWTTRPADVPSNLNFSIILWFMIALSKSHAIMLLKKNGLYFYKRSIGILPIKTLATTYINILNIYFNIVAFITVHTFRRERDY